MIQKTHFSEKLKIAFRIITSEMLYLRNIKAILARTNRGDNDEFVFKIYPFSPVV